jgi:hypothetical protein
MALLLDLTWRRNQRGRRTQRGLRRSRPGRRRRGLRSRPGGRRWDLSGRPGGRRWDLSGRPGRRRRRGLHGLPLAAIPLVLAVRRKGAYWCRRRRRLLAHVLSLITRGGWCVEDSPCNDSHTARNNGTTRGIYAHVLASGRTDAADIMDLNSRRLMLYGCCTGRAPALGPELRGEIVFKDRRAGGRNRTDDRLFTKRAQPRSGPHLYCSGWHRVAATGTRLHPRCCQRCCHRG